MRISRRLVIAVVAIAGVTTSGFIHRDPSNARSVQPISAPAAEEPFDRERSAALFVGVRKFTHRIDPVLNAVDDAVDLAYMFSMEPRVGLVRPDRVVLALSGQPHKSESKERLRELRKHGAKVVGADSADIVDSLREQAALAAPGGLLVVSLATHGFAQNGQSFILGASSLMGDPQTTLSTTELFHIIGDSGAQRSLVFIDACRDDAKRGVRGLPPSTFFRRMRAARGQAILYAAAPGGVAVEGDGNGVFTGAVLEGLQCKASAPRGVVTAETLSRYVDHAVRDWMRREGNERVEPGIQWSFDGTAKNMPLALCWVPRSLPAQTRVSGSKLTVLTEAGERLWERDLGSPIVDAKVADLDALGGRPDVVVATAHALCALTYDNGVLWTATDERTLRAFTVGDLFRKHDQQVVALWSESATTQLTVYLGDGHFLGTLGYPGRLDHVVIARPTAHHAPKIVAAGIDVSGAPTVALFNPTRIATGKPVWSRQLSSRHEDIASLRVIDHDRYGVRDIAVETSSGKKLILDFDGKILSCQ